jgi:hypothetical protein
MKAYPRWPHFEADIVLKYEDGRNVTEHFVVTSKTVGGEYIVFTINSEARKQSINSIIGYDRQTATYKTWGEFGKPDGSGNIITEGSDTLDPQEKTYTMSSTYGDFTEIGKGSYTDTEDHSRTLVYRNGVLFLTRDVISRRSEK